MMVMTLRKNTFDEEENAVLFSISFLLLFELLEKIDESWQKNEAIISKHSSSEIVPQFPLEITSLGLRFSAKMLKRFHLVGCLVCVL